LSRKNGVPASNKKCLFSEAYSIRLGKGMKFNGAQSMARELQQRLHLEVPLYAQFSEGDVGKAGKILVDIFFGISEVYHYALIPTRSIQKDKACDRNASI
jgi:hypothetical protein